MILAGIERFPAHSGTLGFTSHHAETWCYIQKLGRRTGSPCPFLPTPKSQRRLFSPSKCKAWTGWTGWTSSPMFTFPSRFKTHSTRSACISPSPKFVYVGTNKQSFVSWITVKFPSTNTESWWIMHIHCQTRFARFAKNFRKKMDWPDKWSIC